MQDYIRFAEMLRAGFGDPFPAVSLDVLRGVESSRDVAAGVALMSSRSEQSITESIART